VALKVGVTQAGRRASASHTGALAADDRIVEAALAQAGVLRVANVDEMFDLGETFLDCPRPRGNRVAILSEGGGDNSVAADNAERWGLKVPLLSPERQAKIKAHILAGMPAHNPIDYGGTAEENPLLIAACVQEVMADETVDLVYLTGFFGGFKDIIAPHVGELEAEAARRLVRLVAEQGKPLAVHTSFAEEDYEALKILRAGGVPVTTSSDRAAECLAALARQAENARRLAGQDLILGDGSARPAALGLLEAARGQGRSGLLEPEARELLRLYGFDLPPAAVVETAEGAAAAAADLGFPVALKVVAPSIVHKSDMGGVRLDLASAAQVRRAAAEILAAGRRAAPEGYLGLLVSPMAPPGQECILGLVRDPHFGPVLMFGLGGVFVEVLEDVAFGVLPLSPDDLDRMVAAIRGRRLLTGFRGRPALDVTCLKDMLARLSRLAQDNPEIQELDLNPVLLHLRGASVVDARVILNF
jgi:acetyltransferase